MMNKKLTGVRFTPQEFRLLSLCLRCGKAGQRDGEVCSECIAKNIPNCSICEILMRNGKHTFFTYDIKEDHRGSEVGFKVSKEYVREFTYEVKYDNSPNPENICNDCIDWQKRMKNRCRACDEVFKNTTENYKNNGNYCESCADSCKVSDEHKNCDDRLEGEGIRNGSESNKVL